MMFFLFLLLGKAYVNSMCLKDGFSVSVVEDSGGFLSVLTATHELGHRYDWGEEIWLNNKHTEEQVLIDGWVEIEFDERMDGLITVWMDGFIDVWVIGWMGE